MRFQVFSCFAVLIPLGVSSACSGKIDLGTYGADDGGQPLVTNDGGVVFPDGSTLEDGGPRADASPLPDSGPVVPPIGTCGGTCSMAGPSRALLTTAAEATADLQGKWTICSQTGTTGIGGWTTVTFGPTTYTLSGGGANQPDQTSPLAFETTAAGLAVALTDVWFTMDYNACPSSLLLNATPLSGTASLVRESAAPPPSGCSLAGGTWDVTQNDFYGTDASFQFAPEPCNSEECNFQGTFIGGPRSAALPAGSIYSGAWKLADGALTVSQTQGLQCNMGSTSMNVTFNAACTVATLVDKLDDCTGAREYFEGTTVLTKR